MHVLGLAAIAAGRAIVPEANSTGYVAGVLAECRDDAAPRRDRRRFRAPGSSTRRCAPCGTRTTRRAEPLATTSTRRCATSRIGLHELGIGGRRGRSAPDFGRVLPPHRRRRGRRHRAGLTAHWSEKAGSKDLWPHLLERNESSCGGYAPQVSEADQSSRPEPLVRPPRMHLGREGTASRLELFFDLAYVLVVLELAKVFYEDLTWHGAAVMAGLFVTMWVSWVGFTLYANRFDTDDVIFRIAKLVATGSIAGCAASASTPPASWWCPSLPAIWAACWCSSLSTDGWARSGGPAHRRRVPAHRGCERRAVGGIAGRAQPCPLLAVGDRRAGVCGRTGAGHPTVGQASAAD